jgi:hypothetical protein
MSCRGDGRSRQQIAVADGLVRLGGEYGMQFLLGVVSPDIKGGLASGRKPLGHGAQTFFSPAQHRRQLLKASPKAKGNVREWRRDGWDRVCVHGMPPSCEDEIVTQSAARFKRMGTQDKKTKMMR